MMHLFSEYKNKTIAIIVLILFYSCKKEEVSNPDLYNTKINITSPPEKSSYKNEENLVIKAVITSDVIMHGYEILIHEINTSISKTIKTRHTHGKEFLIDETYKVECIKDIDYILEIIAFIDHSGIKLSEKVEINCK